MDVPLTDQRTEIQSINVSPLVRVIQDTHKLGVIQDTHKLGRK